MGLNFIEFVTVPFQVTFDLKDGRESFAEVNILAALNLIKPGKTLHYYGTQI